MAEVKSILGRVRLVLLLGVLTGILGGLGVGANPASASHTQIYFSFPPLGQTSCGNVMQPAPPETSAVVIPGGPPQIACVWVRNQDDSRGAASFEVDFTYDPDVVNVSLIEPETTWLLSTGRSLYDCFTIIDDVSNDPNGLWHANVGCVTANLSPLGPQGGGLLAKVTLTPGASLSSTSLVHINTFLKPVSSQFPLPDIPTTKLGASVRLAPCADFGPNGGDGAVTGTDIALLVAVFGLNYPERDLNGDGFITGTDIGIIVAEFGMLCP
jgi:hypothetical protein